VIGPYFTFHASWSLIMIIGIDVTSALTQGGGIGRYTRELVQALATVDAQNSYRLFSAKPPAQLPVPQPLPQTDNFSTGQRRWMSAGCTASGIACACRCRCSG
jgi:hypothetical protein